MKNKKFNYRITLTPVDKFYFGGEMTFQVGKDGKDTFNSQYASYIIQSERFPQQTSLLGMLRFLILRNAGEDVFKDNKIVSKEKAKKIIGEKSFSVNGTNDFGVIRSLSRVRILRNDDELEFAPLFGAIDFGNCTNGTYNLGSLKVPGLTKEQYNAKDGLETLMMEIKQFENFFDSYNSIIKERKAIKEEIKEKKKNDEDLPRPPYQLSDIFKDDRRVGIARSIKTGKTDDGALFKQISYRFNDNASVRHRFVFDVEVDDSLLGAKKLKDYDGQMVTVGGDNSQFIIGIQPITEASNKDDSQENEGKGAKAVTLLSPAFLTRDDVRENTCFAVTQLMPFRFLESVMEKTESYHILNRNLTRSARYELYAPGTVFYFDSDKQCQAFIKALKAKQEFSLIGYNEYKTIK